MANNIYNQKRVGIGIQFFDTQIQGKFCVWLINDMNDDVMNDDDK